MKQALHIFAKDVRCLRIEICLLLVLSALFALVAIYESQGTAAGVAILEIAAIFLIGRVIHLEAIPGDQQFWITRPYRAASLCGAKLLFIAVLVCAPIGAAQLGILLAGNYPLASGLAGLAWSQIFVFCAGALPVAALAAVTPGTVSFIFAALGIAALGIGGDIVMPMFLGPGVAIFPQSVNWIRNLVAGMGIAATAALTLRWQYGARRTAFSRMFLAGGTCAAVALFLSLPSSLAVIAQAWLSKEPASGAAIKVSVDLSKKVRSAAPGGGRDPMYRLIRIPVPIVVEGLPPEAEVRADAISVSLEWPGNKTWKPPVMPGITTRSTERGTSILDATVLMDPDLYSARRDVPFRVWGAIYLTLFGDPESREIEPDSHPVSVQDGLQCYRGDLGFLFCRSFFRWPASLVYARAGGEYGSFGASQISYSPFAAGMELDPREVHWTEPFRTPKITIITKKELAHFRRNFEKRDLRLSDFEAGK